MYLAIALGSLLVVGLVVVPDCFGVDREGEGVGIGELDRLAREAKRKGEPAANKGLVFVWRQHFMGLDDAISQTTIVLAVPVASESRATTGRGSIQTWYKLRILETLSEQVRQPGAEYFTDRLSVDLAPATMLPLASDEILVMTVGGTIMIEGVRVTVHNSDFPGLVLNQTYLLFLTSEPTNQVAEIPYGGPGAFLVGGQQDLSPIFGRNWLADELGNTVGDDLSRLRERIRRRASSN